MVVLLDVDWQFLCTLIVYVVDVDPSADVTTTVMVLFPSERAIGELAAPLCTEAPFTVIVEYGSVAVGVTVMEEAVTTVE